MARHTENLLEFIKQGGNLSIDCERRNTENILKLVRAMQQTDYKYTLRNLHNHHTDNVLKIIRACGNNDNITLEV